MNSSELATSLTAFWTVSPEHATRSWIVAVPPGAFRRWAAKQRAAFAKSPLLIAVRACSSVLAAGAVAGGGVGGGVARGRGATVAAATGVGTGVGAGVATGGRTAARVVAGDSDHGVPVTAAGV